MCNLKGNILLFDYEIRFSINFENGLKKVKNIKEEQAKKIERGAVAKTLTKERKCAGGRRKCRDKRKEEEICGVRR